MNTYYVSPDGAQLSLSKYAFRKIQTLMFKVSAKSVSNAIVSTMSYIYIYQGIFLK